MNVKILAERLGFVGCISGAHASNAQRASSSCLVGQIHLHCEPNLTYDVSQEVGKLFHWRGAAE